MDWLVRGVDLISAWAIPLFLVGVPLYALTRGVKIYPAFVEGAKEGFQVALRIIPFLVAILAAVGAFRAVGAMDLLADVLRPITDRLGVPVQVLPMMIVRPLSGGGATGLYAELLQTEGPDAFASRVGALVMGSTETTFYVLAVYFGAVGVTRYRHAIPAALIAELAGFTASVIIATWIWG